MSNKSVSWCGAIGRFHEFQGVTCLRCGASGHIHRNATLDEAPEMIQRYIEDEVQRRIGILKDVLEDMDG